MSEVPNDIVELIIAVDLNPNDPSEPINVKDVNVRDQGEEGDGEGDWRKLCMQVLMGDPRSGVTSDSIDYDEAVEAVARLLGDDKPEEDIEKKPDPFSRANSGGRMREDKPERPTHGGGGGMRAALENAIGRKKEDEDEEF